MSIPSRAIESKTLSKYGPAALLTIHVGKEPDHQEFVAHESFLICRSEFFRRAVNGRWEEAETRVVKLPEDSSEVFARYLDCAYTNRATSELLDRPSYDILSWNDTRNIAHIDVHNLNRLYILADKLQDPATKNAAIRTLFRVFHWEHPSRRILSPSLSHISMVYENTPEHSPLRCLFVDITLRYPLEGLRQIMTELPREFLMDLAIMLQGIATNTADVARQNGVEAYLERS
ncbi:hypothetical protein EKO04_000766 [Ascochyta lentis]|uniref:BTB domain-containing protein n=1 Tax=Ascochyta lentis TaxID=205686 RepID=A0A8H7MME2_9PLEO|nr:hypothetical protein EKO04_000766 [Ascochyta lentis]